HVLTQAEHEKRSLRALHRDRPAGVVVLAFETPVFRVLEVDTRFRKFRDHGPPPYPGFSGQEYVGRIANPPYVSAYSIAICKAEQHLVATLLPWERGPEAAICSALSCDLWFRQDE